MVSTLRKGEMSIQAFKLNTFSKRVYEHAMAGNSATPVVQLAQPASQVLSTSGDPEAVRACRAAAEEATTTPRRGTCGTTRRAPCTPPAKRRT